MNRRDILRAIPALIGSGTLIGSAAAPVMASAYATEAETACRFGYTVLPHPLKHQDIIYQINAAPSAIGRTVLTSRHRPEYGGTASVSLHTGTGGLWLRRLPTRQQDLRIGIVGRTVWPIQDRSMIDIAAAEAANHLRSDYVDGVAGLSPHLGVVLGLHRIAPYFVSLPGLVTWETWLGQRESLMTMIDAVTISAATDRRLTGMTAATLTRFGTRIVMDDPGCSMLSQRVSGLYG